MKFIYLIPIIALIFACTKKGGGSSISVEQLLSRLGEDPNTTIIDVRTVGEFNGPLGHIAGATSIPLSEIPASINSLKDDDNATYYMICKSGARSAAAVKILKSKGLNAINVSGGMMAWSKLKK